MGEDGMASIEFRLGSTGGSAGVMAETATLGDFRQLGSVPNARSECMLEGTCCYKVNFARPRNSGLPVLSIRTKLTMGREAVFSESNNLRSSSTNRFYVPSVVTC